MEIKGISLNKYPIPQVYTPKAYRDARGYFFESFVDLDFWNSFVQDNQSGSIKDVIRGMHYQVEPYVQEKVVRVIRGKILDVSVDMRRNSPTFGKYFPFFLSEENNETLYIPEGFAHGFAVVSSWADVLYKVSEYYNKESERTLLWNDPYLKIPWPVENPILSKKDQEGQLFLDCDYFED